MPGPMNNQGPGQDNHTGYYTQQQQQQQRAFYQDIDDHTPIHNSPPTSPSSRAYSNYNDNTNFAHSPTTYSTNNNAYHNGESNNTRAITRQPTQQQLQQLQLQRQHQQRLQEQIQAEDSLRMNLQLDMPPAAVTATAAAQNLGSTGEPKPPPSYYSYPPQPSHSPTSQLSPSGADGSDSTLKARLARFVRFPCSTYGKGMILVVAVEAVLVIIMQVVIVLLYFDSLVDDSPKQSADVITTVNLPPYLDPRNQSRSIPAYLMVFVFAQIFQLVIAWDAVRAQNTIELIGIVIFNVCCFAYSIFEISQIRNSLENGGAAGFFDPPSRATELQSRLQPFLIVDVCVIGISQCLVTWLAYQLFQEFGWKIYKKIGADPNMKKMYRAYQIYLVLIKVDLFFFVGFSIQFIYLALTRRGQDPEYWLTIIVLPLTVLILFIAVYAVRHESRKWMATFLVAMLAGVVYFVFKVVRMYIGEKAPLYKGVNQFLTLFASLCLITILATIANATICYRNFGKGLKPHLLRDARESPSATSPTNGRIMVID
ncbi:hypothetical protein BGZ70_007106 [Mortierella alpina]|uniref:Uncharacterized protein n=1 Tax=Mortierella alpina TaxID=64518 RepID=A0A9P6J777_MORAP|nr:hypothetical protein BGZ70_007106 [Mortierella alpina]